MIKLKGLVERAMTQASNHTDRNLVYIKNAMRDVIGEIPDNFEEFNTKLKSLSKDKLVQLASLVERVNKIEPQHTHILYHGTTSRIADLIRSQGFKLTKGKRSGFMGSDLEVPNLGVFLSDSRELSYAYGSNRDISSEGVEVLKVYANLGDMLLLSPWTTAIPLDIRKLILKEISTYEGKVINKPRQSDLFWALDQKNVVDALTSEGYDGVIFIESKATLKYLNISLKGTPRTFMVFDPSKLTIAPILIKTLEDLYIFTKD